MKTKRTLVLLLVMMGLCSYAKGIRNNDTIKCRLNEPVRMEIQQNIPMLQIGQTGAYIIILEYNGVVVFTEEIDLCKGDVYIVDSFSYGSGTYRFVVQNITCNTEHVFWYIKREDDLLSM